MADHKIACNRASELAGIGRILTDAVQHDRSFGRMSSGECGIWVVACSYLQNFNCRIVERLSVHYLSLVE